MPKLKKDKSKKEDRVLNDVVNNPELRELLEDSSIKHPRKTFSLSHVEDEENLVDYRDDEQENHHKKLRRHSIIEKVHTNKANEKNDKNAFGVLSNLSAKELEDHYSKCIQLCNQNKVNANNAFQLQLIDYMKMIIQNQPSKSENLALMSCTLDASAKIYSFRVDRVYIDMMKLVSGTAASKNNDDFNSDDESESNAKSKKKKAKTDLKEVDYEKKLLPLSVLKKDIAELDGIFKERTFLPSKYDFFMECPIRESTNEIIMNPPLFDDEEPPICTLTTTVPKFVGSFQTLKFAEWIPSYNELYKAYHIVDDPTDHVREEHEDETEEIIEEPMEVDHTDHCDLDATPEFNYADHSEEELDNVNSLSPKPADPFSIKSMSKLVSLDHDDYSFFDMSRLDSWKNPSHWSAKIRKKSSAQRPCSSNPPPTVRKRKKNHPPLDFTNSDGLTSKFAMSNKKQQLSSCAMSRWKKYNLSYVSKYSAKNLFSLFQEPNTFFVNKVFPFGGNLSSESSDHLQEDLDSVSLLMDNTDECDEMLIDKDSDEQVNIAPMESACDSLNPAFELIPAPQMVKKLNIHYEKFQKRINIKLLKKTLWETLNFEPVSHENLSTNQTLTSENQVVDKQVKFSSVLQNLPAKLPESESSQLSFALALMALLFTANEKTLHLENNDNDILITSGRPPSLAANAADIDSDHE